MQHFLLLDVVVAQSAAILQLDAGEDQALLVNRDADVFRVLDLLFHVLDCVAWQNQERNRLASKRLHKDFKSFDLRYKTNFHQAIGGIAITDSGVRCNAFFPESVAILCTERLKLFRNANRALYRLVDFVGVEKPYANVFSINFNFGTASAPVTVVIPQLQSKLARVSE